MFVIEIIVELFIRIFVQIIFEMILLGAYKLLKRFFSFVWVKVLGFKPKPINPLKALENKLLYKIIELTANINSNLKIGQKGVILEVLDENIVLAEFLDNKGEQTKSDDNIIFELRTDQFRLIPTI